MLRTPLDPLARLRVKGTGNVRKGRKGGKVNGGRGREGRGRRRAKYIS